MSRSNNGNSCDEIVPGLWIGSLTSIKELPNISRRLLSDAADNNRQTVTTTNHRPMIEWTIITVLESEKLLCLVDALLTDITLKEDATVSVCQHVIWNLPDKSTGDLLSSQLESILSIIDRHVLVAMENDGSRNSNESNISESSLPFSCCKAQQPLHVPNTDDQTTCKATKKQSCCLVHCAQGISRSAAISAAWLISRNQMSLQNALSRIRTIRPRVNPNLGFLACLRALEQSNGQVEKARIRMQNKTKQNNSNNHREEN